MESRRAVEPAYLSVPLIESPAQQYSVIEDCDFTIRTQFLNYTGRTITAGFRNGLQVPIRSKTHRVIPNFIVREELYFSRQLKDEIRNFLLGHDLDEVHQDLKNFRDLFMKEFEHCRTGSMTLKHDYVITPEHMKHGHGNIYLFEKDIILSTDKDNIPLHPFSRKAMRTPIVLEGNHKDVGGVIHITDNAGKIGPKYIRMIDKIIRIDTRTNPMQQDGVYVTYRGQQDGPYEDPEDIVEYYPPEKISELSWLYSSYLQAKQTPDQELETNLKIKEIDLEGKKLSAETTVQKSEFEKERIALEKQNAYLQQQVAEHDRRAKIQQQELDRRLQQEKYESELTQLRAKDVYEERSASRKDSSELLKVLPTIVVGVGAALMAIHKLFN